MKIQQLIEEQKRGLDKLLDGGRLTLEGNGITPVDVTQEIKSFMKSYGHKLIEAVGEELTGCKYKINPRMKNRNLYLWQKGYNFSVDDSRLKLKEIIKRV